MGVKRRFNVLDILIAVGLCGLLAWGVISFVFPRPSLGSIESVDVLLNAQVPVLRNYLNVGDDLYNLRYKRGKLPYAKIEEVISTIPAKTTNVNDQGYTVLSEHPLLMDIRVRVHFNQPVLVYPEGYKIAGSTLRMDLFIDAPIVLNNYKISARGKIIGQKFIPHH